MSVAERARLLGFGLLAVTFVVGALAGAAVDRAVSREDGAAQARAERRENDDGRRYIIDRVEMSEGQRATIDSILHLRVERMQDVWREVEPRLDAITDSTRMEIMAVLTPDQRAEYERMLDRRRGARDQGGDDDENDTENPDDPGAGGARH